VAGLLVSGVASADALDKADTAWLLTSTALVLFMTLPGLALFYAGLVRSRNVLSVVMQCFAIACMVSVIWVVCGYSMAFGDTIGGYVGGLGKAWLSGVGMDALSGTYPETVFIMFQLTFAIITPALFVGGIAERMRFSAMLIFVAAWVLLVYFPVAHWVWGGGWLADIGFRDFAGGAVVHVTAGVAALVAALVLGNRSGFPDTAMPPHNLPMTVTGACMLWVGWFGFNAGSALAADGAAGMAMLVTQVATGAASLTWMGIEWVKNGKPSVLGIVTAAVAGLVAITPASGSVGPLGAIVIGIAAGACCFWGSTILKFKCGYDDSLDVFGVHGIGGIVGALLTGIFVAKELGGQGLAEGMTIGSQFAAQAIGVVTTLVYSGVVSFIILKVVDAIIGLRVSEEDETQGLDIAQHEEQGYNLEV
jgi:Amt family ammonium transporter